MTLLRKEGRSSLLQRSFHCREEVTPIFRGQVQPNKALQLSPSTESGPVLSA
jgi:hypothetical protein